MREYLDVLQCCSLFSGIAPEDLIPLTACLGAKTVAAEKGQPIFREGDPARWMGWFCPAMCRWPARTITAPATFSPS